jgi:hypothetical protein
MELIKLLPPEYKWLAQSNIFSNDLNNNDTGFSPWYLIREENVFEYKTCDPCIRMIAIARRQDNDDYLCCKIKANVVSYSLLHNGWMREGFEELESYDTIWIWMKSIIDHFEEMYSYSLED